MDRHAAVVIGAAVLLLWIVAVSPVIISSPVIAAVASAWCRWLDQPIGR